MVAIAACTPVSPAAARARRGGRAAARAPLGRPPVPASLRAAPNGTPQTWATSRAGGLHVIMQAQASNGEAAPSASNASKASKVPAHPVVEIYDTTLRDGAQMVGISLTAQNKLDVAKQLVAMGAQYIEGGYPGSNPKDQEFFNRWGELDTSGSGTRLAAFGSTRHKNTCVEEDKQIATLLGCGAEVITIVAKAWDEQVEHVLEASLPQNLEMIKDSVEYLKSHGRTVMVDLEHFFDGCKSSSEGLAYSMECMVVAAAAGADVLVLCDTNGGCLPWEVEDITRQVAEALAPYPEARVGIHAHNDTGMAVANSLAAIRGGASLVQGCVNGYGERTGNADLCTIIGCLQVKMGYKCVHPEKLHQLTKVARAVAKLCEQPPPRNNPFVGSSAFAHKGGLHVAAVRKLPHSYNHMEPSVVGNQMRTVVSELSGRGNVLSIAEASGRAIDPAQATYLLAQIKKLESTGYSFEGASASVDMMMMRSEGGYERPFVVLEYSVMAQNRAVSSDGGADGDVGDLGSEATINQATVKLEVDGQLELVAAEGNGPVNALSNCLRKSLKSKYPQLRKVHLVDYSVRLLDTMGSRSITRVTTNFRDGDGKIWTTVGAHASIIESSFRAITDGLEYGITRCDDMGCEIPLGSMEEEDDRELAGQHN